MNKRNDKFAVTVLNWNIYLSRIKDRRKFKYFYQLKQIDQGIKYWKVRKRQR